MIILIGWEILLLVSPGLTHLAAFRWRFSWAGRFKIASFTCLVLYVSWGTLVLLHVDSHLPALTSIHDGLGAAFQEREIRYRRASESLALELTQAHLCHILLRKASY